MSNPVSARRVVLAALLIGLAAALYWRLTQPDEVKSRPGPPAEQAVTVIQPKVADTPLIVEVNGSVTSLKAVDVRSQVSNLVREVLIREGQVVRQGQTMFLLDDRNDRANVEKLRATLARNKALATDLDRQLDRAQDLRAQNFISQGSLETTRAQREAQWALVKADEAALLAAEVALDHNTIRAPISGRTGAINVFQGTLVLPSGLPLVTITQVDPIAIQFSLPESQYARLQTSYQQGQAQVFATVPATGHQVKGQLHFVDNTIDPANGTLRVKAQVDNPKGELWPGQFIQIKAQLGVMRDAVLIPPEAVVTTVNGRFVYVVGEDLTVKPNPIKDVYANRDILVVSGLAPEARLVLDGRQNLRPGAKVRIITPSGGKK